MTDGDRVDGLTNGEIGRLFERIEKALATHDTKLDAVLIQTTKTNGRVNGHDDKIAELERVVAWAWRLIIGLNVTVVGSVIVYWVTHP